MVVDWMENGNLRQYLKTQLHTGELASSGLEKALVQWARSLCIQRLTIADAFCYAATPNCPWIGISAR